MARKAKVVKETIDGPDTSVVNLFNKQIAIPTWLLMGIVVFIGAAILLMTYTFQSKSNLKDYMTIEKRYIPPPEPEAEPEPISGPMIPWTVLVPVLIGQLLFTVILTQNRRMNLFVAIFISIMFGVLAYAIWMYVSTPSAVSVVASAPISPP